MSTSDKPDRWERLEALGAVPCPDYADREGQTLVMFYGEARADPPDPYTVQEAERDLAAALAAIERDLLTSTDEPAEVVERAADTARRARERYADALNTITRPPSTAA